MVNFKKRKIQIKNTPRALGVQKTKLLLWKIWIKPDCWCQRHLSHAHCWVCLNTDMCHRSGNGFLLAKSPKVEEFLLKAASRRLCFSPIYGPNKRCSPSYNTVQGSFPKLVTMRCCSCEEGSRSLRCVSPSTCDEDNRWPLDLNTERQKERERRIWL